MTHYMTVGDILKTSGIIMVLPDDSLSVVLSKLSSSHDTAFVFENDQLLGVVTPYYSAIKKTHNPQTKVRNLLVHPPKIEISDQLNKVARLMTQSKMHFLPVFEGNAFKGIVSAKRILTSLLPKTQNYKQPVAKILGRKKIITIRENDTVVQALHLFKEHSVSRLVVVLPDFKLKGILTQYDLIGYFAIPKNRMTYGSLQGEKVPQHTSKVINLYKKNILTISIYDTFEKALDLMIHNHIGSVVVVDESNHPVDIVTTGDLLKMIITKGEEIPIDIKIRRIRKDDKKLVDSFINRLSRHLKHLDNLIKLTVAIDEHKQGGVIDVSVRLSLNKDRNVVIKKSGKNITDVIANVIDAVDSYASKK